MGGKEGKREEGSEGDIERKERLLVGRKEGRESE